MKVAALQKLRRLSSQGVALAVLLLLTAPLEYRGRRHRKFFSDPP